MATMDDIVRHFSVRQSHSGAPKNHLIGLPTAPFSDTLLLPNLLPVNQLTRAEAERLLLLRATEPGTFLVRNSSLANSVRVQRLCPSTVDPQCALTQSLFWPNRSFPHPHRRHIPPLV
jgi:hypothetical protein